MTPILSEQTAAVVVALLTFLTVVYNGYKQAQTARKTNDINDAVNNRHLRKDEDGKMPPKLYDLAISNNLKIEEIVEWKNGYDESPFGNTEEINKFCDRLDGIEDNQKKIMNRPPCMIHDAESKTENIHPKETKETD